MAGNLNIAVTADTTQLRSGLAMAQADMHALAAEIRKTTSEMRTAGDEAKASLIDRLDILSAKYNTAQSAASGFSSGLRAAASASRETAAATNEMAAATTTATSAHGELKLATAGSTRELLVLGHEALTGNFSRIPGSVMVLMERMGSLHTIVESVTGVMWAVGGAAIAAAGSFAVLTMRAHETESALRGVYNASLLQGRGAQLAREQTEAAAHTLAESGTMSEHHGLQVAAAIVSTAGATEEYRRKLLDLVPALHLAFGTGDTEKTTKLIEQNLLGSIGSLQTFARENNLVAASQQASFEEAVKGNQVDRARMIVLDGLNSRLGASYRAYQDVARARSAAANTLVPGQVDPVGYVSPAQMAPPVMPQLNVKPISDDLVRARELYAGVRSDETEMQALLNQRATLVTGLAATEDASERALINSKLKTIDVEIQQHRAMGDASWFDKQRAALRASNDEILNRAKTHQSALTEMHRNEAQFWAGVAKDASLTEGQRNQAELAAAQARRELRLEELTASQAGAKKGLEAQLSALNTEQSENRNNLAYVIQIENKKLALIEAAEGRKSKMYEDERRRGDELILRSVDAELQKLQQAAGKELEIRRALLDEKVAMGEISKAQEQAQLQQFVVEEQDKERQALNTAIDMLQDGTNARAQAILKREQMERDFQAVLAKLHAQEVRDAEAASNKTARDYMSSFSSIESSGKRAFSDLLMGTTTWGKAMGTVMKSVLEGFVDLGLKLVGRWMATQVAMTMGTAVQAKVRTAIDAGESGWGAIMTAILTKWGMIEAGKEALTAAGAAARLGVEKTADVTALATGAATRVAEVEGEAAVGAAAAWASTAAIPIVGPELAPAASAATYAGIMALAPAASAAQGAWDLPRDMVLQAHAGEMIIPQRFAETFREKGGLAGGGGGGENHFHIHAIDTQSGAQFLMRHMDHIARGVTKAFKVNPSLRPAH